MEPKYQVGDIVRLVREREGEHWERIVRISIISPGCTHDCTYSKRGDSRTEGPKICPMCDGFMYYCEVLAGKGRNYQDHQRGDWAGFNMQKLTDEELAFYLI